MKKRIITKFGDIFISDLEEAKIDEKIKIYDSDENYFDYIEYSSLVFYAESLRVSEEDAYSELISNILSIEDIEELAEFINENVGIITSDIKEIAKAFNCSIEEVENIHLRNEFINRIGDFWIEVED